MKKILMIFYLLLITFFITGCKTSKPTIQIDNLTTTSKIVVKKNSETIDENLHTINIENKDQINNICNDFMSLSLVEDETYIYVSYVDPQAANYEFIFYNGEDEVVKTITITWLNLLYYNNKYYKSQNKNFDINYVEAMFEHTYTWYRSKEGHYKLYTCGCKNDEKFISHNDSDDDGCCDICKYKLDSNLTESGLNTTSMFYSNHNMGPEILDFFRGEDQTVKKYLIIDDSKQYFEIFSKLPSGGIIEKPTTYKLFTETKATLFFTNNVIIIKLRFISGSIDFVPVNYFYEHQSHNINMEYLKLSKGTIVVKEVFLGCALDIIECPKEYFKLLTQESIMD